MFLENLNSAINMVIYSFFLLMHTIAQYLFSKYKKNWQESEQTFTKPTFWNTKNQLQKKFQDGNNAIETK